MAYNEFAYFYDEFNGEADYDALYRYITAELQAHGIRDGILADLGCGTGDLTLMLTQAGYDVIGIDRSEEMLSVLREKADELGLTGRLLLLRQDLLELDLYGTVEAAICCLDSINYLTRPRDVQRTFNRLHDAIAPGGSLVFDVHAVSKMEKLDGEVLLDEREDVFCLWRTRYRKNVKMLDYEVDLFRLQPDGAWERDFEEHHQRAYTVEELTAWLEEAGFTAIRTHGELKLRRANERDGRIYFSCIRK